MESVEYVLAILIVLQSALLMCLATFVSRTEEFQRGLLKKLSSIESCIERLKVNRLEFRAETDVDDDVALVRGGKHAPPNLSEVSEKVSGVLADALGVNVDFGSMVGAVMGQLEQIHNEPAMAKVKRELDEIDQ